MIALGFLSVFQLPFLKELDIHLQFRRIYPKLFNVDKCHFSNCLNPQTIKFKLVRRLPCAQAQ